MLINPEKLQLKRSQRSVSTVGTLQNHPSSTPYPHVPVTSPPQAVTNKEIDDAVDRIVAGLEGKPLVDGKAKSLVAYHEVGHAICGTLTLGHDPVQKVTLIPRGQVRGFGCRFGPLLELTPRCNSQMKPSSTCYLTEPHFFLPPSDPCVLPPLPRPVA